MKYLQQGDTLAFELDKLPEGLIKIKGKTIAYGKMTGHNHTFYDDTVCTAEKFDHVEKLSRKVVD